MEANPHFITIFFTPELPVPGEAAKISTLLSVGACDMVHLRHPSASEAEIAEIIADIPPGLRSRVAVHDAHQVGYDAGCHVHLNSRTPHALTYKATSSAAHSIDEALSLPLTVDYAFLSPIYDSISKHGYAAAFNPEDPKLRNLLHSRPIIALGGVRPSNRSELIEAGFAGMAMLGAVDWTISVKQMRLSHTTGLQFITDGPADSLLPQAEAALRGGCRWVQLRMKDAPSADVRAVAEPMCELCHRHGATFIINDHPDVAKAVNADGVHLGKNDMSPADARQLLGPEAIIGATANSLADALSAAAMPVDYLGVGPVCFTHTKKNLAPVLGVSGIADIAVGLHKNGHSLPFVAIGGVTPSLVAPLIKAGASGVAVSGAIAHAADPVAATQTFMNEITNSYI